MIRVQHLTNFCSFVKIFHQVDQVMVVSPSILNRLPIGSDREQFTKIFLRTVAQQIEEEQEISQNPSTPITVGAYSNGVFNGHGVLLFAGQWQLISVNTVYP